MTQVNQQPPTAQTNGTPATQTNGQVAKKNIVDTTLSRIKEMQELGELSIPKNYSFENALRSAMLILQETLTMDKRPALQACTQESISYALLRMVVQGLNPMKRQCSFIVYGNKLTMQREYQGSITLAKRAGLKSVIANAVFDGDEFIFEVEPETGRKKVVKHVPNFDSFGGKVKGAYAFIEMQDGTKNVEVMSMAQIEKAWQQGPTKGQSPAHKNFPDQMACKTVINRAVKTIINSSDDAALFEDDEPTETAFTAGVKHEITSNANRNEIGFTDEQPIQTAEEVHTSDQAPVNEPVADEHGELIANTTANGQQLKAPF